MTTPTTHTFTDGVATSSEANTFIRDPLQFLLNGAWTSYTVQWTGSGSNPAIVNGQLSGEYQQIGKLVRAKGFMVAGSSTTYGTGNWQLNYPVTPNSRASSTGGVIGMAYCLDFSTGAQYVSMLVSESTSIIKIITSPTTVTANTTTPTVPFTWAVSDRFSWWIEYEVP